MFFLRLAKSSRLYALFVIGLRLELVLDLKFEKGDFFILKYYVFWIYIREQVSIFEYFNEILATHI